MLKLKLEITFATMIRKIFNIFRNKYLLVLTIFGVWVMFFDKSNIINHIKLHSELRQLKKDKNYYKAEIEKDSITMQELLTNPKNLEKFAREEYLMKRPNEDIYVIIEE